jgi:CHAT domain-containing protein/Tfp pilus assembly protein PilF
MLRLLIIILLLGVLSAQTDDNPIREYSGAWILVGQGRADDAIPLLEALIAKAPNFWRAYKCLVDAYRLKNDVQGAEQYFQKLLAGDPANGIAHYGLGLVSRTRREWGRAVEHYTACAKAQAPVTECYQGLAEALIEESKRAATLNDFRAKLPGGLEHPYACFGIVVFLGLKRNLSKSEGVPQQCFEQATKLGDTDLMISACRTAEICQKLADEKVAFSQRIGDQENELRYSCWSATDEACLQKKLAFARSLGHREWIARTLAGLFRVTARAGNTDLALQYGWEAVSLIREWGDLEYAAIWVANIGGVYHRRGELAEALRCYRQSVDLARGGRDNLDEAFGIRAIGVAYQDMGDYFQALRYGEESLKIFEQMGDKYRWGAGIGNIGIIHALLGDYPTALRYTAQSYRSGIEHEDIGEQQRNDLVFGDLYLRMREPRKALPYLQEALALHETVGTVPFQIEAKVGIAVAWRRLLQPGRALPYLQEALATAREKQLSDSQANALVEMGWSYLDLNELDRAGTEFQQSLEITERAGFPELIVDAHRGLAEIARRKQQYRGALQHLEGAIDRIETVRGRIPTPELQTGFVRENSRLYEDAVYILSLLHNRDPKRAYDRQAFAYSERGRARVFLDLMADSKVKVAKGLTPDQMRDREALARALSEAMKAGMDRDSAQSRQAVAGAEQKLIDWDTAVRLSNPRYYELQHPEPYDARKAQALAADSNAAVLEYALGPRRSLVWVITRSGVKMIGLPPRREIEKDVAALRNIIAHHPESGDFDTWREPARRLYRELIQPALPWIAGQKRLVVVPDGILHYLPFEALLGNEDRLVAEDFTLAYAPSVSVFGALRQRPAAPQRRKELLAYGDPVFSTKAEAVAASQAIVRGVYKAGRYSFPPLPNTRQEVIQISQLFRPDRRKIRLGAEATESSVKAERLTDYRRLHFASHAVVDEAFPSRSGIVLSLVNTRDEDGILRMNEIFNLDLNAETVVVSACQTGLGKIVRGEGMIGLTRAFLYAGTSRVVVSLWEVNDLATPELMKAFYRGMKDGVAPSDALRQAKLAMLRSGVAAYRHPYFWAAFVGVGEF